LTRGEQPKNMKN